MYCFIYHLYPNSCVKVHCRAQFLAYSNLDIVQLSMCIWCVTHMFSFSLIYFPLSDLSYMLMTKIIGLIEIDHILSDHNNA